MTDSVIVVASDTFVMPTVTVLVYIIINVVVSFVWDLFRGVRITADGQQLCGEYPVWEALRFPELH